MAQPLGSVFRIAQLFAPAGTPVDPVSVGLAVTAPDGTLVGSPITPVHDSTGNYHYDLTCSQVGTYAFVWITATPQVISYGTVECVNPTVLVPRVMTSYELDLCAGAPKVDQLFDDNADGQRDSAYVSQMLRRAEDYALSSLLNAFGENNVIALLQQDAVLRWHVAWICLSMASERRGEFLAADGKGQYWSQHQRADKYFDSISKGKLASTGETKGAGQNGQTGGAVNPPLNPPQAIFTFAPDRNNPTGHGGYLRLAEDIGSV